MNSGAFLDNLNKAVRQNPVAAGLIGLGFAWMVFGKSTAAVRQTSRAAGSVKETMNDAAELVANAAGQVRSTTAGISDAVSEGVQAATSKISRTIESKSTSPDAETNSRNGQGEGIPLARAFKDVLERQPLALGAVGLAVGAAIASAFPPTDAEGRMIGVAGERLRDNVKDTAERVADGAISAFEVAADEAIAQDLTPSALMQAAKEGTRKVKAVAEAVRDAGEK